MILALHDSWISNYVSTLGKNAAWANPDLDEIPDLKIINSSSFPPGDV